MDRLRRLRDALTEGLVERDVAVRLALLAALAGEHLLLVGPPGTAKSLVARRLRHAFKDATCFERLLTRFSVPEELFGPLSIKGLEEDRYERLTESYLPTASIAFLDEIFKANSAILNALLTLLNEREFDNGARRQETPLVAVVGASNELPEGEELDALFDRFLLRLHVDPVSKDVFPDLLKMRGDAAPKVPEDLRLTENDLDAARKGAEDVLVPDDVTGLLCDLREWCGAEEIPVSDRRWRKVVKLLQTSAWTCGRDAVSIWDCWLLQHCLWSKTEDREKTHEWYASRAGATTEEPSRLVLLVRAWEAQFQKDQEDRAQKRNEGGALLYSGEDGKDTPDKQVQKCRDGEKLYILPQGVYSSHTSYGDEPLHETNDGKGYTKNEMAYYRPYSIRERRYLTVDEFIHKKENWFMVDLQPSMEPIKHKPVYIQDCLRQLKELRTEMKDHKDLVDKRNETLESDIHEHLWVMDDFTERASQGLAKARDDIEKLLEQLEKVIKGYDKLPQKEKAPSLNGEGYSRHSPGVILGFE